MPRITPPKTSLAKRAGMSLLVDMSLVYKDTVGLGDTAVSGAPSPNFIRCSARLIPGFVALLISTTTLLAENETIPAKEKTLEEWATELSAAYNGIDGYIGTYTSSEDGRSLKALVGKDKLSNLVVLRLTMTKSGQSMVSRQWNTDDDVAFIDTGLGDLIKIPGTLAEVESIQAMWQKLGVNPSPEAATSNFNVGAMFISGKVEAMIGVSSSNSATGSWKFTDAGNTITRSDEGTVTYSTAEYGSLTLSRKSGLPIRQEIAGIGGGLRILELTDLTLNPGGDAIRSISADWNTDGSIERGVAVLTRGARLTSFQHAITSVEEGAVDLGVLMTAVDQQDEVLLSFAKACLIEDSGGLFQRVDWDRMLGEAANGVRKYWLKTTPGADENDEKEFLAYRDKPEIRITLRDGLAETITEKFGPQPAMMEIFGPEASFPTKTEAGRSFLAKIENALATAYIKAILDRKMERL